jgi:hypothetical protein
MAEEKIKSTRNPREQTTGFIYVALMFIAATVICCLCLFYYSGNNSEEARKEFAIAKMDRIRRFQSIQSEQMVIVDSIFNKIWKFNPSMQASYEENDIKYYLNDIKHLYEENSYDKRYKIFLQVSGFYNAWFADRKELWSKNRNIEGFKKNLEACEIGLQRKKEELKNTK